MREKQREIIEALRVQPAINPEEEIADRTQFLVNELAQRSLNGFALGISGGQDSLLAGIIAQRAVGARREQGHEASFHAMLLPYGKQADRADVELAIEMIHPNQVHDINIKPFVDAYVASRNTADQYPISDYDKGNVKARMRMIAQYDVARSRNFGVLGTDHAAEAVTGFFTKFGDGAADILPLSGLTKRQGKAMLQALGAPAIFYTKAPTADLLDTKPGQADETELGISYDTIDDYLEGKDIPEAVAEHIEARYDATQHKRELPVAYTDVGKMATRE